MFELYISKRNPTSPFLWQKAKAKVHYTDAVWYEKSQVGHDPLEHYMKFLMKDVTLSKKTYTNHSIRSTVISTLNNSGFEAHHIIAVSGHKSESTIKQYAKKCPENKKRQMAEALGNQLVVNKKKKEMEPAAVKKKCI